MTHRTPRRLAATALAVAALASTGLATSAADAAKPAPGGNNGTVKIAVDGALDAIPDNTPHVGCTFQLEWYGYDAGADVVSTVHFAVQAPTRGDLAVEGPEVVPVGADAATGAGTATGLDAVQQYSLYFASDPDPVQGYHVRLTVSTPHSKGADTKSKVFWVKDCLPPVVSNPS